MPLPAPITLTPVARGTNPDAAAKSHALYLAPGTWTLKEPLTLDGWDNGILMGAGRLDYGTILNSERGPAIRIRRCKQVTLCNMWIGALGTAPGEGGVEIDGDAPCTVRLINCMISAGRISKAGMTAGAGVLVHAPGQVILQQCHIFGSDPALLVNHPQADVIVIGGDFKATLRRFANWPAWSTFTAPVSSSPTTARISS